jgi:very-short-patch-repair endonuclease
MTGFKVQPRTRKLARSQRHEMTRPEEIMWESLCGRGLDGNGFRRQVPIVELDGPPHDGPEQVEHDRRRDAWLTPQGFTVLRFSNDLIMGRGGDIVLDAIRNMLRYRPQPPSSDPALPGHLLPQGEKECAVSSRNS